MLNYQQIKGFHERGFLVLPDLFSASEIAEIRAAFERLEREAGKLASTGMHRGSQFVIERNENDPSKPRIKRVVWCGGAEPLLSRFGVDPRLTLPTAQLLGSERMNQLINQAHFKLPGDGVDFPWHQDSTHRRFGHSEWRDRNGRGSYVQTVIAVDDATEKNGPLRLIPGSHRQGHVPVSRSTGGGLPDELIDESRAVLATMKAGSVLFFGPYCFHSSSLNRSRSPRRVLINGFSYPRANSRLYPGREAGRTVLASGALGHQAS